ncbi:MFS transporter [Nonomuraea typhae]|uniref:MFS transporter n=1 Tax=Nonomuraea typhae TaxID=2603600 RepID=A0ABW7YW95_9ACTN
MPDQTSDRAGVREWAGLAALSLPTILLTLDLTVLHLALPKLSATLEPSSTEMLWIADIYGFAIAGLLIFMGSLGDRIGRKRLLLFGAGAFAAVSVVAAYSQSTEMLIAARAVLGVAGATLMPSTLAIIRNMFHNETQRGYAIAIWMTSFMLGGALGPVVGGVMLNWFWWGSVFLMAVPVMGLLLILGPALLPESRDPSPGRIDLLSVVESIAAMLLLVYGIKETAQSGFSGTSLAVIVAGLLIGAVFVRRQTHLSDPLLDLKLFRRRRFSTAVTVQLLAFFTMGGIQLFVMQYLQLVLEFSPLHAGLWSMPSALVSIVASMSAPALAARTSQAAVITGGFLIGAAGMGLLALTTADSGVGWIVLAFVVFSIGLAPVFSLGAGLVVGTAPPERAGAASAIQETSGEIGLAAGMAVLGSVGMAVYRGRLEDAGPGVLERGVLEPGVLERGVLERGVLEPGVLETAKETLAGAVTAGERLGGTSGAALVDAAQEAFVRGFAVISAISVAVLLAAALAVVLALRGARAQHPEAPEDNARPKNVTT